MLRKITTLALAAGILGATPATALPVLYGGNDTGRVFRVDDKTDGNPMTSLATGSYNVNGMAYDFAAGFGMYGGNDNQFFSIDVNTGTKTLINGAIQYDIQDLIFGPGGTLFGGNGSRFFSIDKATGAMTTIDASLTYGIRGLAYDPVSGLMYGLGGASNRFFTIDPGTGNQTLISTMAPVLHGISIDPSTGVLYGAQNPLVGSGNWYSIDKTTGVLTTLGTNPSYASNALAFVPEPGTMLLLSMGLAGLGMTGRKRA